MTLSPASSERLDIAQTNANDYVGCRCARCAEWADQRYGRTNGAPIFVHSATIAILQRGAAVRSAVERDHQRGRQGRHRLAGRLVDRAQAMPSDANDEMWLTSCRAFHSFICLFFFFSWPTRFREYGIAVMSENVSADRSVFVFVLLELAKMNKSLFFS